MSRVTLGDVATERKENYKGDKRSGRPIVGLEHLVPGDITVIEAKKNKIFPALLPLVIQNDGLFDYAVEKSAGSLSPRVKWEHLKTFEFELPNMERQQELATALWSIVMAQKAYQKLITATDELVKSQFVGQLTYVDNNFHTTYSRGCV